MVRKCTIVFQMALLCFGISSVSLFFIPFVRGQTRLQYVLPAVFWVSLVAELLLFWLGNRIRKRLEEKDVALRSTEGKKRIGLLCFAQNREALIADILLAVSVVYLVVVSRLFADRMWIVMAGIAVTYIAIQLHCICNGALYKAIKYYRGVI